MHPYIALIHNDTGSDYGVSFPDLPGCVAVGETRSEVTKLIHEAIEFHLEGMQEDGLPVPEPHSSSELIEVHA